MKSEFVFTFKVGRLGFNKDAFLGCLSIIEMPDGSLWEMLWFGFYWRIK